MSNTAGPSAPLTVFPGQRITPADYKRLLYRITMPVTTRVVAMILADHADYDTGENIHPGEERIAWILCLTPRAVRIHITRLREEYRLIERTAHGGSSHRYADTYRLITPDLADLDRRGLLKPDPELRKSRSGVPTAEPVDNPPPGNSSADELRKSHVGTPEISCTNSGNHVPATFPKTFPKTYLSSSPYVAKEETRARARETSDEDEEFKQAHKILAGMKDFGAALLDQARQTLGDGVDYRALVVEAARLASGGEAA